MFYSYRSITLSVTIFEGEEHKTWNLNKFSSHAKHMRWSHGNAYPSLRLKKVPYWRFAYPIKATPSWFKASIISGGLRGYNIFKTDDEN